MNINSKEERGKIEKKRLSNERLSDFFKEKRETWNEKITEVFSLIKHKNVNKENYRKIVDSQGTALVYTQILNDEISFFLNKLSNTKGRIKELRQDKFIFYSTGFQLKTKIGEKKLLIDGNLAEWEKECDLIEAHIDFLRDTKDALKTYGYTIKNIIELFKFIGD